MGCSDIKILSASVYDSLLKYGYSEIRMRFYKLALSVIKAWFTKNADGHFSLELSDKYEAHLKRQISTGERSRQWTNIKLRSLDYIRGYFRTGEIDFNYNRCSRMKYVPSGDALATIASILDDKSFSQRYKKVLEGYLRKFFCFIEAKGLSESDITITQITEFIKQTGETILPSICGVGAALNMLCERLVSSGILKSMPDFKFLLPKIRTNKILPAYTADEVKAVLDSIKYETAIGKRNYAIILLAVSTGIRAGDILNLKLTDIDWENHTVSLVQEKTDKWMTTFLSGQTENAIADYILEGRPQTDEKNVFVRHKAPIVPMTVTSLTKIMDQQCKRAGVEKKIGRSFHGLRRTFATLLANEGVDVNKISQMLGQLKPNSSKVYMSFDNEKLAKCAMDFADIPITGGVYYDVNG